MVALTLGLTTLNAEAAGPLRLVIQPDENGETYRLSGAGRSSSLQSVTFSLSSARAESWC